MPLYSSLGQGMTTEEKLCRKYSPSNVDLAADNFWGLLGKRLRPWDGIFFGFAELSTENAPSELLLRAFPMWGQSSPRATRQTLEAQVMCKWALKGCEKGLG